MLHNSVQVELTTKPIFAAELCEFICLNSNLQLPTQSRSASTERWLSHSKSLQRQ